MQLGRIPAQVIDEAFRGDSDNLSGTYNPVENIIESNELCQRLISGNKCGHDALIPRLAKLPKSHKKRFPGIESAKLNLLMAYNRPLAYPIGKIFYHDTHGKNGLYRKRRSEIREALTTRVGQVLLHYNNLANGALGKICERTGKFISWGIEFLAEKSGASIFQVRRVLRLYQEYGYTNLRQRKKLLANGSYRSEEAIIEVNFQLYLDLGVSENDLIDLRAKQNNQAYNHHLKYKVKENESVKKSTKKTQKKYMKSIREILAKAQSGSILSDEERTLLEKEMPGYGRAQNKTGGRYRDYTGVASEGRNRDEPKKAAHFLGTLSDHAEKIETDTS